MGANLQLQAMYGLKPQMWKDYYDQAARRGQDALEFEAVKSYSMNPMWNEVIKRQQGTFDPRTQGRDFTVQQSHTPQEQLIGHTKFRSMRGAGGIDPNGGSIYSGPQFQRYRRG